MSDESPPIMTTKEWVTLILSVITLLSGMTYGVHKISADFHGSMVLMDEKWQERLNKMDDKWQERHTGMQHDITDQIKDLATNNPPAWFKDIVDKHEGRINQLEDEVRSIESRLGDND
jgi:hypothetical protein